MCVAVSLDHLVRREKGKSWKMQEEESWGNGEREVKGVEVMKGEEGSRKKEERLKYWEKRIKGMRWWWK